MNPVLAFISGFTFAGGLLVLIPADPGAEPIRAAILFAASLAALVVGRRK